MRPLGSVERELLDAVQRVPAGSWVPVLGLVSADDMVRRGTSWRRAAYSLGRRGLVEAGVVPCPDGQRRLCVRIPA